MKFSDADVAEILRILDASPFDELEIETERLRLTLQRAEGGGWGQQRESLAEPSLIEAGDTATTQTATNTSADDTAPVEDGLHNVLAPIVGTFYRSPQPGAPPFVEVGDRVEPDTVVAIIEVMKLMNSVPAGIKGEVVEIRAQNAQQVAQGQCLLRIRPEA